MAVTVRFDMYDATVRADGTWELKELRLGELDLHPEMIEDLEDVLRDSIEAELEYLNGVYGPDWTPEPLEYVPFHALAAARAAVEDMGGEIMEVEQPPDPPPGAIL